MWRPGGLWNLEIADGTAHVPSGPGLGIEVDEAKVIELVWKTNSPDRAAPGS